MLTFEPKTEMQLNEMNLLPEGVYTWECVKAISKVSQAGNDMIEITLKIWGPDGKDHIVFDRLMPAMMYKLKHYFDSCGHPEIYQSGNVKSNDCEHKSGNLHLIIEKYIYKSKDENIKPVERSKNSVKDYIITSGTILGVPSKRPLTNAVGQPFDDGIEF